MLRRLHGATVGTGLGHGELGAEILVLLHGHVSLGAHLAALACEVLDCSGH